MEKLKEKHLLLFALASGLLLWLAWPPSVLPYLIFIAFVPLLLAFEVLFRRTNVKRKALKLFGYSYISFVIWNLLTTYWIYHASPVGSYLAIGLNALFMCIPVLLMYFVRNTSGKRLSIIAFISLWISLEYLYLNWDMAWPWLNLGNVFSMIPGQIQWYEYTGAFGGTLWVLALNFLISEILIHVYELKHAKIGIFANRQSRILSGALILTLVIPFIASAIIGAGFKLESPEKVRVAVVQPNIDPYGEKFDAETLDTQFDILLNLSRKGVAEGADLIIWPETAFPEHITIGKLQHSRMLPVVDAFLAKNPGVSMLAGLTSFKIYESEEEKTLTARPLSYAEGKWYDVYNSAFFTSGDGNFEFYHKSILVPGVEKMPYPAVFGFLENYAIDLGGTAGSLGRDNRHDVFEMPERNVRIAPIICYESVFGEFTAEFINKNANLIAVITNDGWWRNTSGYVQHFHYASLRAVEFRRSIARSANTGISGFFDPKGNIVKNSGWWHEDVLVFDVSLNDEITFYARHGDYIARIGLYTSAFILLTVLVHFYIKRTKRYV